VLLLAATCHALVSRLCCSVCVGSVVRVRTMYLYEFSKWPGPAYLEFGVFGMVYDFFGWIFRVLSQYQTLCTCCRL